MKVAIFGLGYVGSTAAGCTTSQGHTIIGVDMSDAKVAALSGAARRFTNPGSTICRLLPMPKAASRR